MNGETLFRQTNYFRPFPSATEVFAHRVQDHADYLLPLATVDLSHLNPEWYGPLHFVVPIEPDEGVVGESTEQFHTTLCCENWIGYHVHEGRYVLACEFDFFQKSLLETHYERVRAGYELRKTHFSEHGYLHNRWAECDPSGQYDERDRVELVCDLGGMSFYGNWSDSGTFPVSSDEIYVDDQGEEWRRASPLTADGREFEYIGSIPMYHYIAENRDYTGLLGGTVLLFYDPVESVALTTFEWT